MTLPSFEQIQALQSDALMVDVVIGQAAGWELLERLHASAAITGIPVLVLSTSPRLLEWAQTQAERYGNLRYGGKPCAIAALLAHSRAMIGAA
jgi:DNA-binding response OmpR family regulator